MAVRDLSELSTDVQRAAEALLAAFEAAIDCVPGAAREDALAEVRAHVLDVLRPDSTERDVAAIAEDLGEPVAYAAALAGSAEGDEPRRAPREGTLLGVPFGLNMPGTEAVALRWWNPRDPRIFVPRVFGIGWDVNFGSVAVRLNLIEPDSEDEPFALVPDGLFAACVSIPVVIALAFVTFALLTYPDTPPRIATHWSARGVADGWWPRATALAFSALWVIPPTAWAVVSVIVRRKPLNRGVTIAFATLLGTAGAGFYAAGVLEALGRPGVQAVWASLVAALVLPFVELVILARTGRAEELRRAEVPGGRGVRP